MLTGAVRIFGHHQSRWLDDCGDSPKVACTFSSSRTTYFRNSLLKLLSTPISATYLRPLELLN